MQNILPAFLLLASTVFSVPVAGLSDSIDDICGVVTNEIFGFGNLDDTEWCLHGLETLHSRPVLAEALRRLADVPHETTNYAGYHVRQNALFWLRDFGTTNEIPLLRSRVRTETGQDLFIALEALSARLPDVDAVLAEWSLLLHEDRTQDPEFQNEALDRVERMAEEPNTSPEDRRKLDSFLIAEFPVENRTVSAVWTDRHLTNAVPSWATNEARRTAAERILALPTTPLPFVTNHFVRVLASFPPPDGP